MEKDSNLHSTLIGRVSLPLDDPWIGSGGRVRTDVLSVNSQSATSICATPEHNLTSFRGSSAACDGRCRPRCVCA
jgi:hypothetical protein